MGLPKREAELSKKLYRKFEFSDGKFYTWGICVCICTHTYIHTYTDIHMYFIYTHIYMDLFK